MKIALLCGGPSLERGISLNSARSVLDHVHSAEIEIIPIYFDEKKNAYKVSPAQLYSNTPSDFDFKLHESATPLTQKQLVTFLKKSVDLVFPVMHGPFGEDGEIQKILEKNSIPFIGSGSVACKQAFDKFTANEFIRSNGFTAPQSLVLKIYDKDHKRDITAFFKKHAITRAVVKPATGGSSIGVFSVTSVAEACEKVSLLFSKRMDTRVVIEPFAAGIEFTVIILQNKFGLPVAILPTEIETDYRENQIFDYRRKYLPTRHVTYHCPPRFSQEIISRIQAEAEQLFSLFQLRDFARFDGWLLNDGTVWFSDFNPISGMEQNSFLFQQAARVGLSHSDMLRTVIQSACIRYGLVMPKRNVMTKKRKPIGILFGGTTSERQVSLMSGTNVWLKLRNSDMYEPTPYLLDNDGAVWQLPYSFTLNHTVEEISENCSRAAADEETLGWFVRAVRHKLSLKEKYVPELPKKMTLEACIARAPYLFLALHGGDGEGGVLQEQLARAHILFNGSSASVSRLCMDKYETNVRIREFKIPGVSTTIGMLVPADMATIENAATIWSQVRKELKCDSLVVKPRADGCSSGVVHLYTVGDFTQYMKCATNGQQTIPEGTFSVQSGIVEMPAEPITEVLCEAFVGTDTIRVVRGQLHHEVKSGYVEVTVGVLEIAGKIHALNPSITVADGEVLSLEEKFQGGTGVNITPPPESLISKGVQKKIKERITRVAECMKISGYARIDAFVHCKTGEVIVIEINTLPGLTPSTVLYHQGLAEKPQMFPRTLLEKIIKSSGY